MPSMKFTKQWLQDLQWAESDLSSGATVVENKWIDSGRWLSHHSLVFAHKGKFYRTTYYKGLTEQQYEAPFDYAETDIDDKIECEQVRPTTKVVTFYEKVP